MLMFTVITLRQAQVRRRRRRRRIEQNCVQVVNPRRPLTIDGSVFSTCDSTDFYDGKLVRGELGTATLSRLSYVRDVVRRRQFSGKCLKIEAASNLVL